MLLIKNNQIVVDDELKKRMNVIVTQSDHVVKTNPDVLKNATNASNTTHNFHKHQLIELE